MVSVASPDLTGPHQTSRAQVEPLNLLIKALKLVTSITTFPEGFGGLTPGEKETVVLAHKQIIACCIKHSRGNQFARKLLEVCPEQWPLILEKEIEYLCKSFEVERRLHTTKRSRHSQSLAIDCQRLRS